MRVVICKDTASLGRYAAAEAAASLGTALAVSGEARLLLATGQSQFETLEDLVRRPLDWPNVHAFHLDEYVGLPAEHPASFRQYLKERVADIVPLAMHYIDPASPEALDRLQRMLLCAPVDVALVGIGENGHLAFNDPPADFATTEPYLRVQLDQRCRRQQVREGWFARVDDVPAQAVTMSISTIMASRRIISAVPYEAKAAIVRDLLATNDVTPTLPASALRGHQDVTVVLDRQSSRLLPIGIWRRCVVL